jgi:hypothetical protein
LLRMCLGVYVCMLYVFRCLCVYVFMFGVAVGWAVDIDALRLRSCSLFMYLFCVDLCYLRETIILLPAFFGCD